MTGPDFRELVGDDLTPEERAKLEGVDRLLRSVGPPPPEIPGSLTRSVAHIGTAWRPWTPRRLALVAALTAALAALFFGVGRWTNAGGPDLGRALTMQATDNAPRASAEIKLGGRDEASGNWRLELRVKGLPKLPADDYYVLWLAKDGEYSATCGTFNVGPGTTTVDLTVSYRLKDYDAWVISKHGDSTPWLLTAKV